MAVSLEDAADAATQARRRFDAAARRRPARRERLDTAVERQGLRWLDDVDATSLADLGCAGPGEGRRWQLHRANRIRPRSAEGLHHRQTSTAARPFASPARSSASFATRARSRTTTCGFSSSGARSSGRRATNRGRRATAASFITCTRRRAWTGAPGRAPLSCRFRNTMSAISTRSGRRLPFAPRHERAAAATLRLRSDRRVDVLLAEPGLAWPMHQTTRQREADR